MLFVGHECAHVVHTVELSGIIDACVECDAERLVHVFRQDVGTLHERRVLAVMLFVEVVLMLEILGERVHAVDVDSGIYREAFGDPGELPVGGEVGVQVGTAVTLVSHCFVKTCGRREVILL